MAHVQERQVRLILENIEGGAPSAGLASVQKLLKKTPGSILLKALKAYALANCGDNSDRLKLANSLIDDVLDAKPADAEVLLIADKALRALGRQRDLAQLYEHAYAQDVYNFELGTQATLYAVRAGAWNVAHRVAMKMYRLSRSDTHCWWAVCAAVLQAGESTTPPAARPVLLRLALQLIELAPLPSWVKPDRFLLHCDVLSALDWGQKALNMMEYTAEGQLICGRYAAAEDMRRRIAYDVGNWLEEGERARTLIEEGHYAWDVMTAYINSALYIVAPPFSPSTSSESSPPSPLLPPVHDTKWPAPPLINEYQRERLRKAARQAAAFFTRIADREDAKQLSLPEVERRGQERGPLLALLTLEARVRAYGEGMSCLDLADALKRYVTTFAPLGRVCFEDVRPFLVLLDGDGAREEMREWVEGLAVDLSCRAALRRTTTTLALYRSLSLPDDDALLCAVAFARLWKRAVRVFSSGPGVELVESSDSGSAPSTLSPVSVRTSLSAELDKIQRAGAASPSTASAEYAGSPLDPRSHAPCITLSAAPQPAQRVPLKELLRRVALEEVSDEDGGELCPAVRSAPHSPRTLLEVASPRQDGRKEKEALPPLLARAVKKDLRDEKEQSAPSFFARKDNSDIKDGHRLGGGASAMDVKKDLDAKVASPAPVEEFVIASPVVEEKKPKRTVCPPPKLTDDPAFYADRAAAASSAEHARKDRADFVDQRGELHPADDLAVLSAQAFVCAWKASDDPGHLLPALCILSGAARHSPRASALRLHLVRVYRLLGCGAGPALEHYGQMKDLRAAGGGETMGHWVLARAGAFGYAVRPGGPEDEDGCGARLFEMCGVRENAYAMSASAAADAVVECFEHERYMSINEILALNDRLERSLQSDLNAIEHMRMALLRAPKPNVENLIAEMRLMVEYEPHDNRDFEILPNYQPVWSASFAEQTELGGTDPPGSGWRSAFVKLYLRAFGKPGEVPNMTNAELAQLTSHERGLFDFVDAVNAWVGAGAQEKGEEVFMQAFEADVALCVHSLEGDAILAGEILHAVTLLHERYVCYNLLTAHLASAGGGEKNKKKSTPTVRTVRTRLQDGMKRVAAALKECAGRQTVEIFALHCVLVRSVVPVPSVLQELAEQRARAFSGLADALTWLCS